MEKFPPLVPAEELKVLIIDNQGLVHDVISNALKEVGIRRVDSAFNAFHAVRLCEQNTYDFVMIAFNVSVDKDGFHLFEELKHHRHITDKTTVIFLSAETSQALVNCIVELQPADFWVKPLDRNRIEQRLRYLINIRSKLHKLQCCLNQQDYSTAVYYAERQLMDKSVSEYHPRLKRIIGESYLALRDYTTAEVYFRKLLQQYDHAWVHMGLARALLRQNKLEETETLVEDLLQRDDTRFLTYDLLAQYYIEKEEFDKAYEQMREASKLAPRNIERNKRLWDLARLNHDKPGQLMAVQNMAKYAKNSIHDSPELTLNVMRATLDMATTASAGDAEKLVRKVEAELAELSKQQGLDKVLTEQFSVLNARVLCLRNQKKSAEAIMKTKKPDTDGLSMEDNLDKMKAFHELGMREHCLALLEKLHKQIAGDTFTSQVVDEYLKQESIERKEINFTTRELKDMAAVNYKENRFVPAYNNLRQALTLSPGNKQIALSLLKVLVQLNKKEPLSDEQLEQAVKAATTLSGVGPGTTQAEKRNEYVQLLNIEEQLSGVDEPASSLLT